ncbi:MAG: preprotein translocase subunit SecG [Planctomycetota bacterium]|nr:preprotein translocase subunit SecG [Planctomycetota bacterium]
MGVLFLLVFFLITFLIVGLVLLQEGKGGGLTGMSTGMDGVMGARNPLRRMTAYLFVAFVLLAIGINYYFHRRGDVFIPEGVPIPEARRTLEENAPFTGPLVVPEAAGGADDPEAVSAPPAPIGAVPAEPPFSVEPEPETGAPDASPSLPVPPTAAAAPAAAESAPPAPPDAPAETTEQIVEPVFGAVDGAAAESAPPAPLDAPAETTEQIVEPVSGAVDGAAAESAPPAPLDAPAETTEQAEG